MQEEKEFILSKDGKKLCVHYWLHSNESPTLAIVHGLGEHGMRYAPLAAFMNANGVNVFALTLRGHGESEGKRGHSSSFRLLQSDIEEFLKFCRSECTESPLFLMGHSMGGNLVAHFVKAGNTNELNGFILSAPFFAVAFTPQAWKVNLAKAVGSLLPSLTQSNELDVTAISRDEIEVEKYRKEPLIHDQISVRLFLDITSAGERLVANKDPLKIPGLVYHGDADRLISFDATAKYVENNPSVEWIPLKDTYHEPHNDLNREQVYHHLLAFINKHK